MTLTGSLSPQGVALITCANNRLDAVYKRNLVVLNQLAATITKTTTHAGEGEAHATSLMQKFMRELKRMQSTRTNVKCMVRACESAACPALRI